MYINNKYMLWVNTKGVVIETDTSKKKRERKEIDNFKLPE